MVHFIWPVMRGKIFFTSSDQSRYKLCSYQNVCDALSYHLDNMYIRFGTRLYRQIVGIPMGTNCTTLVADLFYTATTGIFFWIRLTMIIKLVLSRLFYSTSRYHDDFLKIDNPYFVGMVNQVYPPELHLNKANTTGTESPFFYCKWSCLF